MSTINNKIKAEANRLGFSFLQITRPIQPPHYEAYLHWLADSHTGEMKYLSSERTRQSRQTPAGLLDNAQSILTFGVRYAPLTQSLPSEEDTQNPVGLVASYALHADYHDALKQAAHRLMDFIVRETGKNIQYRVFVDSSALLEKDTAFMAGAGWIGKNSLIITPETGSFQVLGCILTDLELISDKPFSKDLCGSCQKCQDSCPTGCITDNHNLRADECIAYLTIEYKGVIPRHLRSRMGLWVFGCDICQNVCPWNHKPQTQPFQVSPLLPQVMEPGIDLLAEIKLDEDSFRKKYAGSPILRATHTGFQRNLIIAMGNSGSQACLPALKKILRESPAWLLRLHAAWAISSLRSPDMRQILEKALSMEDDERVRDELRCCLNQ
ncbi:tRNA epoxyqueuosine(34) reductase QueG [Pelolinea submarina]|uniref:tRNA epoxyqueuosine(34) reductase QueG n=1 Tax=Pelolinea submarina TaxID=913107 RepID=UPI001319FDC9|nr:tRNA epoxyqueuosine(34) reductase QueG [Pelolinea submarina]